MKVKKKKNKYKKWQKGPEPPSLSHAQGENWQEFELKLAQKKLKGGHNFVRQATTFAPTLKVHEVSWYINSFKKSKY